MKRTITDEDKDRLKRLLEEGRTLSEIAQALNVRPMQIRIWIGDFEEKEGDK